ncbi:hypothetical protein BABINDRAFT_171413 [Babjeviella inositovora NRRL Y-12698]|uniref:Transport and Golgi organization protein 2 n=1 Tax=Babjeviella inositovora NRRL Y-12698 TaxID=984486 RepID=A0A1E3QQ15_9ASCO|nr:uncharacterized protein BABINDRAFT_171413 [Babjeviella inositovora NRRL Y-12698]ODQ79799.1 hypothetical protein BABINDRAFT_171413 [Babjeviella inositovora NRRL Y-12698]
MCISIASTKHPEYPFILISNRDEYLVRPTALAHWHHANSILSPYDLARAEQGTWIGINKFGRLALLVNYRENTKNLEKLFGTVSRGLITMDFLENAEVGVGEWESKLIGLDQMGGFSMLYGDLGVDESGNLEPMSLINNRAEDPSELTLKVFQKGDELTIGLSNSLYNQPWPKVILGKELLNGVIRRSTEGNWSEDKLVEELFEVLSHDTYVLTTDDAQNFNNLRESIYIPAFATNYIPQRNKCIGNYYGTRTQTIILLDRTGTIHYVERNLFSEDNSKAYDPTIQRFSYSIQPHEA